MIHFRSLDRSIRSHEKAQSSKPSIMLSKSVVAATLLAGASAGTTSSSSYAHPGPQGGRGPHGHPGPRPCTTTSTAVVYATETVTSTVVQSWGAGGRPTWVGVPGPVTVTVTVSPTGAWGGSGSGSGSGSGNGGWGASGSTTTVAAGGSGSGSGNGGWGAGGSGSSSSVAGGVGSGSGGYGAGGVGGKPTTTSTTGPSYTGTAPSGPTGPLCLTNATASYLANGYGSLLSAYTNATANSLLASDFTDTSDSINWLAGIPLGGYTFSSKAAFIAGQGTQLPIGFTMSTTSSTPALRLRSAGLRLWAPRSSRLRVSTLSLLATLTVPRLDGRLRLCTLSSTLVRGSTILAGLARRRVRTLPRHK